MKSLSLSQPHAIVMVGIPGSGKTQFAQKFAETFSAPFVDDGSISSHAISQEATKDLSTYMLGELAKTKATIIIECDTNSRTSRTELSRRLRALAYTPVFVWVQTDPETARSRSLKAKRHSQNSFDEATKRFSAPHPSEQAIVISGKHTYASQAKIILKHLSLDRVEASTQLSPPPRPRSRGNIMVR